MLKIENIQEDLNYLITESNIKDRYALELLFKVNVQATELELQKRLYIFSFRKHKERPG